MRNIIHVNREARAAVLEHREMFNLKMRYSGVDGISFRGRKFHHTYGNYDYEIYNKLLVVDWEKDAFLYQLAVPLFNYSELCGRLKNIVFDFLDIVSTLTMPVRNVLTTAMGSLSYVLYQYLPTLESLQNVLFVLDECQLRESCREQGLLPDGFNPPIRYNARAAECSSEHSLALDLGFIPIPPDIRKSGFGFRREGYAAVVNWHQTTLADLVACFVAEVKSQMYNWCGRNIDVRVVISRHPTELAV